MLPVECSLYRELSSPFRSSALTVASARRLVTVKAVEAHHPCRQYSKKNRSVIGFCFLFLKKSLRNSYCNPSYAPPNGSNIRIGRKQITKQYSNSHPIMKIYFQIRLHCTLLPLSLQPDPISKEIVVNSLKSCSEALFQQGCFPSFVENVSLSKIYAHNSLTA